MARVPLAVAIGMAVTDCDDRAARGTLPLCPATTHADGTLDPLALLPFVDQLSSFPLSRSEGAGAAMSTIDLAIDLVAPMIVGPVTADVQAIPGAGRARHVVGLVRDATGAIVATSHAWFAIGAPPGGGSHEPAPVDRRVEADAPFRETIGVAPHGDDGAALAPDVWAAVGWVGLPALHGGAIAAALGLAAIHRIATLDRAELRLATLAVRYLRAADTTGSHARATIDGIGRRTARLAVALENAGAVAATAQALFVAD